MTPSPLKAALRVALACAALPLVPAAAHASTWTVDDDGVQCPDAPFSSIQAAVDAAAPNDTLIVCDGLYQESSTPPNGSYSPAQPGSRNGLTIQKPLTIKGAGAGKVFIEPSPVLGDSLAGPTPYLRDGGGNVITIARSSLGSSDDNENTVDISGVTVRSPYAYAEAGIAYFNTSGTVSRSTVGPLRRANPDATGSRPHGWGVVQTNSLQGAGPGSGTVRRQVSVVDSLVKGYQAGGILFDGGRGADGTPEAIAPAGITQYGTVAGSKVVGGGDHAALQQVGIRYAGGVRGAVTGSTIASNGAFLTGAVAPAVNYNSYGILLSAAATGVDVDNPAVRALTISGNAFLENRVALANAEAVGESDETTANVITRLGAPVSTTDNWWGCIAGPIVGGVSNTTPTSALLGCQGISGNDAAVPAAPSVELGTIRKTVPATLAVPVATPDAAPTASFSEPIGAPELSLGDTISPVVSAKDDFGVASVTLAADGKPVATLTRAPYEFGWAPTAADTGKTVALTATVTDSSGQTTVASISVKVAALLVEPEPEPEPTTPPVVVPPVVPAPKPPVNTALPVISGDASVGETVTCLPGSWTADPTAYAYGWLRAGQPIAGATGASYALVTGDTASELACRVTAANADGNATATSTAKLVRFPLALGDDDTQRQVGPVVVTVAKSATASSKTGKLTIGSSICARALAKECTVTLTGSIKIGTRAYSFGKVTLKGTGTTPLTLTLPASARKLLKGGKKTGTLRATIAATDDLGFKSSWRTSLQVKGTK